MIGVSLSILVSSAQFQRLHSRPSHCLLILEVSMDFYLVGAISGGFSDLYFVTPAGRNEVFKLRTGCNHEVQALAN